MRESVYVTMASRELHVKEHNVKMIAVIMDSAYQCSISQIKLEIVIHKNTPTINGMQTRYMGVSVTRVLVAMIVR